MKNNHFFKLLATGIFLFLIQSPFAFSNKNSATNFPKGIYVVSDWNKPIAEEVLKNPNVDGVFVRLLWDKLQPEKEKYDWGFLDAELKRITASSKKISLGVAAGSHCPDWIYDAGVTGLDFDLLRHQGKGKQFSVKVPVPWNETYLKLWTHFIEEFSKHLKTDPATYQNISLVKLTGINESTIEIKLPGQKEITGAKGKSSDAIAIWQQAGYKPQLVKQAWKRILTSFSANFNDKYFSMGIIPKNGFPLIDEAGKEIVKKSENDFTQTLIENAHDVLKDHLIVQWNAFSETGIIPKIMQQASQKKIITGYQVNEGALGHPECLEKKTSCDEKLFKSVLNNVVASGASFVEIFADDVKAYPGALAESQNKFLK